MSLLTANSGLNPDGDISNDRLTSATDVLPCMIYVAEAAFLVADHFSRIHSFHFARKLFNKQFQAAAITALLKQG
jgi:hypothetical protein